MNKRVKRACAWIAWAAVCLIIAVAGVGFSDRIRLETIMAFTEQDRIYYGIDSVNKEYRVFMKDLDTGKSDWLSQPWTNSGNKDTFYVMDLEAFGPEEVYVCYAVRPENKERSLRLEIIHYDLVHHREQERYFIPLKETENYFAFSLSESGGEKALYVMTADKVTSQMARVSVNKIAGGKISEETGQYMVHVPFFQGERIEDGSLVYLTSDGSVWQVSDPNVECCIYSNQGLENHNVNYYLGSEGVSFYNLDTKRSCQISYEDQELKMTEDQLGDSREKFGNIVQMISMEDGGFAATVMQENFHCIPVVLGSNERVIEEVSLSALGRIILGFQIFSFVYLAGFTLYVFYYLIRMMNRGVFPTALKIVCIVFPMAGIGYFIISRQADKVFEDQLWLQEEKRMEAVVSSYVSRIDLSLYSSSAMNPTYADALEKAFAKDYPWEETIAEVGGKSDFKINRNSILYNFYRYYDGEMYPISYQYLSCAPVSYTVYGQDAEALSRCVSEKQVVCIHEDTIQEGEILAFYFPLFQDDECVGAIRAMVSAQTVLPIAKMKTLIIRRSVATYLVVMIALLFVISTVSIHSIRKMEKAVRQMREGRVQVKVALKGQDEMAQMRQIFNRMSNNISSNLEKMEHLKNTYEPFVPRAMIRLLGKEDVRFVYPGDRNRIRAAVATLGVCDFERIQSHVGTEEIFEFLSRYLKTAVLIAEQNGGILGGFSQANIKVIFPGGAKNGRQAVCRILQRLREERLELGGSAVKFSAGIAEGELVLTAVGTGSRMEIVTDGGCLEESVYLKKVGEYLGAGCLVSEGAFLDGENPAGRELSRLLIWRREADGADEEYEPPVLRFYQVYADETSANREKKEKTKEWFEQGIQLFGRRKWREARENFAAVLREDIHDQPAGVYFSLCDEYAEEMSYESD